MITTTLSDPLVVIVGATGQQGGSVIKALAESNKRYRIRGITRDVTKPASKALQDRGVEMISASTTAETRDQIDKAFHGANIVFGLTNFWEHANKQKEIADGKAIVDAARSAKVDLFVWSGLEDVSKMSHGKYTAVDHFDGKAAITEYAKEQGLPIANVQPGPYASNFLHAPKKQDDGTYILTGPGAPDTLLPILDTPADYGKFVRAAIESPQLGAGSEVYACGDEISWAELAKTLSEGTGQNVVYKQVSEQEYIASLKGPDFIRKEICQMYQAAAEFGYFAKKDIKPGQAAVTGGITTWADYVKRADWSQTFN